MKSSLLISLALALAVAGCNKSSRTNTAATDTTTPSSTDYTATSTTTTSSAFGNATSTATAAADRMASDMRGAANSASSAMGNAASSMASTARMTQWKLNATDIQADLDNNREIVRTKDSAGAPTGNADKSVLESLVKGRLAADNDIAALKLDVDADKTGTVKLSGKAHSAEEVGRAIALALDTEGVTKVSSKVKIDRDAKTNR